jgi:hypothetical protein
MPERPMNIRNRGDSRSFRREEGKTKKDSFASAIGWSIFLILLIALVALCWLGTYYVFGHPEEPTSYAILKKLDKIEQPRRFVDTAAPRGEFLTGNKLFERFDAMRDPELKRESAALLRDFLWNYKNTSKSIPYITGRFNILDSFELTGENFFPSGVAAIAVDTENPKVLLEYIFTAEPRMVPMLHRSLLTGLDIPIKRTYDLSAVVNVRRLDDGRLVFTAIPLHYPSYAAASGPGGFALEPPTQLNVAAGMPVVSGERIKEADQRYAMYRRRTGLAPSDPLAAAALPGQPSGAPPPANELIRVQAAVPVGAVQGSVPPAGMELASAVIPQPAAVVVPPGETEPRVEAAIAINGQASLPPSPTEVIPPEPSPTATPLPTPSPTPSPAPEVELKPFQEATPTPAAAVASTSGGLWQTYKPGQMPRGRLLSVRETQQMADQASSGERLYLQGNFVVTASGPNRAVLRSHGGAPLGIGGASNTRVIVEFPAGARAPGEGANVSRSGDRPFLITDVKKTADGQINVFVREITTD